MGWKPEDVVREKIKFQTELLKILVVLFVGRFGGTVGIIRGVSFNRGDEALTALGILATLAFLCGSVWALLQIIGELKKMK